MSSHDRAAPVVGRSSLNIPGIDTVGALERAGGDAALVEALLARFMERYRDVGADLLRLLVAGDKPAAVTLVHTLKGNAGNLGIEAVQTGAAELEARLSASQTGTVMSEIASLQQTMQAVCLAIDEARQHGSAKEM